MLAGDGFLGLGLDEQGKSEHPFASARVSMIDVRDVGACAAALLAQPGSPADSAHNGATYDLSNHGPNPDPDPGPNPDLDPYPYQGPLTTSLAPLRSRWATS